MPLRVAEGTSTTTSSPRVYRHHRRQVKGDVSQSRRRQSLRFFSSFDRPSSKRRKERQDVGEKRKRASVWEDSGEKTTCTTGDDGAYDMPSNEQDKEKKSCSERHIYQNKRRRLLRKGRTKRKEFSDFFSAFSRSSREDTMAGGRKSYEERETQTNTERSRF